MAYGNCVCTGKLTTSQLIVNRPGLLTRVLVRTDGTNAASVTVSDGQGGKMLGDWTVPGASCYGGQNFTKEAFPPFDTGLYITISGTGAFAIVDYI